MSSHFHESNLGIVVISKRFLKFKISKLHVGLVCMPVRNLFLLVLEISRIIMVCDVFFSLGPVSG